MSTLNDALSVFMANIAVRRFAERHGVQALGRRVTEAAIAEDWDGQAYDGGDEGEADFDAVVNRSRTARGVNNVMDVNEDTSDADDYLHDNGNDNDDDAPAAAGDNEDHGLYNRGNAPNAPFRDPEMIAMAAAAVAAAAAAPPLPPMVPDPAAGPVAAVPPVLPPAHRYPQLAQAIKIPEVQQWLLDNQHDLPVQVAKLVAFPVQREVTWVHRLKGGKLITFLQSRDHENIIAAIGQAVGDAKVVGAEGEADMCDKCQKNIDVRDRGPFSGGCIVAPAGARLKYSACFNCVYQWQHAHCKHNRK